MTDPLRNAYPEMRTFVGGYTIGGPEGIRLALRQKPSRWHRFWMRCCLDIRWDDRRETVRVIAPSAPVPALTVRDIA